MRNLPSGTVAFLFTDVDDDRARADVRAGHRVHARDLEPEQTIRVCYFYAAGMAMGKTFTSDEARRVGEEIGIDWASAPFDVEQFRMGMDVELEHGLHDLLTNVTDDDPLVTGKIALAHLNEFPDYYTRLERMEAEAEGRE